MYKNLVRILLICSSILLLVGCGRIDSNIEIGNDIKGKWESVVEVNDAKTNGELISMYVDSLQKPSYTDNKVSRSKEEVEELQNYADEFIKVEPLDEEGKVLSDKDESVTSKYWKVTAVFKNEEDLLKTYKIIYGAPQEQSAINVIFPYGDSSEQYMFYMGPSYGTTVITVDGEIDNSVSGTGDIKDHTITFSKGEEIRFVFTKGNHVVRNIMIGIAMMITIVLAVIIYKRRGKML